MNQNINSESDFDNEDNPARKTAITPAKINSANNCRNSFMIPA